MNLGQGERAVKMTTLNLRSKPGVTYLVNDARKTYSVVDTSRAGGQDAEPEKFSVKKLGHERVAGHDCVHALVTGEKGEEWEIWSTKDLGGAEAFWKSLEDSGYSDRHRGGRSRGLRPRQEASTSLTVEVLALCKPYSPIRLNHNHRPLL